MTTLAYRNGVLAADSRITVETEGGGARVFDCDKLFRKSVTVDGELHEVILGTAGESASGMVFVDWYGSGKEPPELLVLGEADFTVLVLRKDGLYEFDKWCRGEKVKNEFYAVGSGAKAAMGAMHMGASAQKAVEIACRIDPYSAPPIVTMRLSNGKRAKVSEVRKTDGSVQSHPRRKDPVAMQSGNRRPPDVLHDNGPKPDSTARPERENPSG